MTSLLNKTNHTKPKPSIPSNPLKHNNFLIQNSLEKSKPSLSHDYHISNKNPLPLSSPINALLPPVLQTNESTTCEIIIADFEFRPKQARVKINSKVQWSIGENKTSQHSGIYSMENRKFVIGIPDFDEESDLLSKGQTYEFHFPKTGNFDVICSNYPRMQGKVEVFGDEDEIMYKKVQHEMKARGLLLSGKQFDEKFFGHGHHNHKPILASPPPKKIKDEYISPYKSLEEAHSEEDTNVQELLQELNAKGPSIKSNKSKSKGKGKSKGREFQFDEKNTQEELFKQLRSRSEASDEDNDVRNFSLDTSDVYRMSDNDEEEDKEKDEELETKYNQILMSPSRFTIHEIMKMGAKLENSMIKKEKLEEENKRLEQAQRNIIEPEAPINQGDILIEIRQELENNDHEDEKLKENHGSEKEMIVLDGEQEKENLNEKPKKKNKNKKKKKKKAAKHPTDPESAENTPNAQQDSTVNTVFTTDPVLTTREVKDIKSIAEESNKVKTQIVTGPKSENKQEKPKDSLVKETKNKSVEKENNSSTVLKAAENEKSVSKPVIEEQKFQTVVPSSTIKGTKNQNIKEVNADKKRVENKEKVSTILENKSNKTPPKNPVTVQQQGSSKLNGQKAPEIKIEETKSQSHILPTPSVINEKPKEENLQNTKDSSNNHNKEGNKKKRKKNSKKRKELNTANSVPSESKTEVQSLEKLEVIEGHQDIENISPIPALKETVPVTAETSDANSSEEKESTSGGNEAFLAFLKDAVKPEASKYQKSFRSNKNKNKKAQKEIDYTEEDDRIAALSAFLSNRYEYAEAFN